MAEGNGNTSLKTKWFEISGRKTAELITILLLCVSAVGAYAFYKHTEETKESGAALVSALKELASANQAQVKEARVMNCLLSVRQEDRRNALSDCERIAR